MSGTTISNTLTGGVRLTVGSQNSVTVTSQGYIYPTAGTYAIYGSVGYAWTISNAGILHDQASDGVGIQLMGDGSVGNTGNIVGHRSGVLIEGPAGTVVNQNGIEGYLTYGIALLAGGTVSNAAGGLITAGEDGVYIGGAAGTVVNAGHIADNGADGIRLNAGGIVSNATSALIAGTISGVIIQGAAGTVINQGNITGAGTYGIALFAGGTVSNATGATINGGQDGVTIGSSAGTVLNQGGITGTGTDGVALFAGGMVSNAAGGSIIGGRSGVVVKGQPGTVINQDDITGSGTYGVALLAGGMVSNASGGSIMGGRSGVLLEGQAGTVINQASIGGTGTAGIGVDLGAGGMVSNATGAVISGSQYGVTVASAAGTVVNQGGITGTGTDGIVLSFGGTVSNAAGGLIMGGGDGVLVESQAGTVINLARITGTGGYGITLSAGGMVSNATNSSITGGGGVRIAGQVGTVVNQGSIAGTSTDAIGVYLTSGGMVSNAAGAAISGDVIIGDALGTVINQGTIAGHNGSDGVHLSFGGLVSNAASAVISGGSDGVGVGGALGTVVNQGSITATGGYGILLFAGGTVSNTASAAINGSLDGVLGQNAAATVANAGTIFGTSGIGVYLAAGGTVTNSGTIMGGNGTAVSLGGTGSNRLVLDPNAVFSGVLAGGASASNTLELASAGSTGTLSGLGSNFTNFGSVIVDTGATWDLTGTNSLATTTTLTNDATLTLFDATLSDLGGVVNGGAMVIDASDASVASLTGSGTTTIEAGSTFAVQGAITAGETIGFGGNDGILGIGDAPGMSGTIEGFIPGDTIDLTGLPSADISSVTIEAGNTVTIVETNTTTLDLRLDPSQSFAGLYAQQGTDGASGTDITLSTALCFCAGTLLRTPRGDVRVEQLAAGDEVVTWSGDVRPITWIGAGRVRAIRWRRNAATPVIVRRNALADNVPDRDLRVTKGHSFYLDDVLIPVEFLVNHRSILWDDHAQEVALYHVELASHDVLVANGAPAESYRDDGNRWLFQNANSGWNLPPQKPCAPVLTGGVAVNNIWRRLLDRVGSRPRLPLTDDPRLHLLLDGEQLEAAWRDSAAYIFRLPARPAAVRIASRAGAPAELGLARDPRVLGVAVRRIALRQGTRFRIMEASDPLLVEGFHAFERDGGLRWTDGDAALPKELFEGFNGPMELVLHVAGTTQYPLSGEPGSPRAQARIDAGWGSTGVSAG